MSVKRVRMVSFTNFLLPNPGFAHSLKFFLYKISQNQPVNRLDRRGFHAFFCGKIALKFYLTLTLSPS